MQDYEVTLRGRKTPVRFEAARLFEGSDWIIAYNDEDEKTDRFQTKDVIMLRRVEPKSDGKHPGPKFGGFA